MFRMPPHKIFLMSGSKYENLETQEKMYVGDTLIPRAESFEEQFAKILLSKKERLSYFFQFDRAEMTLRDTKAETERTRSEEHTSELQSLIRISYAVFCLQKKK